MRSLDETGNRWEVQGWRPETEATRAGGRVQASEGHGRSPGLGIRKWPTTHLVVPLSEMPLTPLIPILNLNWGLVVVS